MQDSQVFLKNTCTPKVHSQLNTVCKSNKNLQDDSLLIINHGNFVETEKLLSL